MPLRFRVLHLQEQLSHFLRFRLSIDSKLIELGLKLLLAPIIHKKVGFKTQLQHNSFQQQLLIPFTLLLLLLLLLLLVHPQNKPQYLWDVLYQPKKLFMLRFLFLFLILQYILDSQLFTLTYKQVGN